jgi:hypothetical protein
MPPENAIEARAHRLLVELAQGRVDRNALAPDASEMFTREALDDIHKSLAPLGNLERVRVESTQWRGGTKHYALTLSYRQRKLQVAEYDLADGKIEQFFIDDKQ